MSTDHGTDSLPVGAWVAASRTRGPAHARPYPGGAVADAQLEEDAGEPRDAPGTASTSPYDPGGPEIWLTDPSVAGESPWRWPESPWRWPRRPGEPARGHRRTRPRGVDQRTFVAVAMITAAVTVAVALVLVNAPGGERPPGGPGPAPTGMAAPPAGPSPAIEASRAPALKAPPQQPPTTAPTFRPLTLEAESPGNTVAGGAVVLPYTGASGGSVVALIGQWGSSKGEGILTFTKVVVPASGTYTLTIYYVLGGTDAARSLVIQPSGGASQLVTVTGDTTCCYTQAVAVHLVKGGNSITFSNSFGHAPGIDRIVISRH